MVQSRAFESEGISSFGVETFFINYKIWVRLHFYLLIVKKLNIWITIKLGTILLCQLWVIDYAVCIKLYDNPYGWSCFWYEDKNNQKSDVT